MYLDLQRISFKTSSTKNWLVFVKILQVLHFGATTIYNFYIIRKELLSAIFMVAKYPF